MNLSKIFIARPIGTTLLAIGLALAGMVAFALLPVSSLPQIDFPTINVNASLPGASPEIMATSVATPLERQLGRIAGITQMTSSSNLGTTNISIQFDLSRDIDGAARDVQAAINAARSQLPTDLPGNPSYRKVNPADSPIMLIAMTSDYYNRGAMYDAASTILQQKISQIEGVGQVLVGGGSLPAVRVELNPNALGRYGISLEQVRTALAAANVNMPKGQLISGNNASEIITDDQLFQAAQYQSLIIAYRNNLPVRLRDIASVQDSVENVRTGGLADGKPSVVLVIFKQPNANVITTVDRVRALLPGLQAAIPAGMKMTVMMDRTSTIRASLHDVELTLVIAVLLVIAVAYVFLGSARAALIPSVAVPLSLLGTFGVMYLAGFSLDNLSLMALTISTGFVVDDAVVVLENSMRHIEAGLQPLEAAMQGAQEVGFTVLSMSLSLIAVFIPILFMGGIVGRLFREFALTLSAAILLSLIISLTVTPMMCARLLRANTKPHRLHDWIIKAAHYHRSLKWALAHPRTMLLTTVGAVLLTIILFVIVPKGFFPQQDTGRIMGSIQAQQNISFQAMQAKLQDFVRILQHDPAVQNVAGFIGSGTTNTGNLFINLKPAAQRPEISTVITRLRKKLAIVPGATLYLQPAQDLVIGGRMGNAQFQFTVAADNLQDLNVWAPRILDQMRKLPGIADVNSDQLNNGSQVFVTYDHDTAARLGLNSQLIDQTLYDAFGQRQVSVMYKMMNQYHVVMEAAPQYWQYPNGLNTIYIPSATGAPIPLSAFASFAPSTTLLSVNHQNQFPSATFSFNLLPKVALGDAVSRVSKAVTAMHLPATLHPTFQGTAQAFQASLSSQPYLILLALLTVYIVLGILYESYIHPITILSTIPSAGVGALVALLITHTELSIIAIIGMILLIGIVKKNAIMMIDFAQQMREQEKMPAPEAIYQAALLRYRPILMTTMAAMLGAVPLVIGLGVGAELRRPLGITIVGGLILSQLLTLYTTPVIYLAMEKLANWGRRQMVKILLPWKSGGENEF